MRLQSELCFVAALSVSVSACTAMPRASLPQDEPFVLMVHAHHEEGSAKDRSTDTVRGFARLSMDSGFGMLEVWHTLRETHVNEESGIQDAHSHRTAITWRAGDAMSEGDALVIYFDGSMTSCRSFGPEGEPGSEHACQRGSPFTLICRPSAVLVDDAAPDKARSLHPSSALKCGFDGPAPTVLSDMLVEDALWFPLEPNVRLSREGGKDLRFEPAPGNWTALEKPASEP